MENYSSLIIHCSNSEPGGAERSVLAKVIALQTPGRRIRFILPGHGAMVGLLARHQLPYVILPWPSPVTWFNQRQLGWQWVKMCLFPFYSHLFVLYIWNLWRLTRSYETVWSSGLKSHCMTLALKMLSNRRTVLDVRDFIKPRFLRKFIAGLARVMRVEVVANSKIVGQDYCFPRIEYPIVSLARPARPKQKKSGMIISHAAFFAPYKGQDIFLTYAKEISNVIDDVEFWIIGDVIYPGKIYEEYKRKLYELVREHGLENKVTFLGRVSDVQEYLEQSHYLLHTTREPEPFGRVILEGLLCGCRVMCHRESGVNEKLNFTSFQNMDFPDLPSQLPEHVFVELKQ